MSTSDVRVEVPGYSTVHLRLRKAYGPASNYPCEACGGAAHEYGYDHSDPAELTELRFGSLLAYSVDLHRYAPLCRSCHKGIDAAFRPLLTEAITARAVELYRQGVGSPTIADELGCSHPTVLEALRRAGVAVRTSSGATPSRRPQCRRAHRLIAPNLVESAPAGQRRCRACTRADYNARDARRHGVAWSEAQIQARADEHYARIMSEGPATRQEHCLRGHRLATPNLYESRLPVRHCLACARARNNAYGAKRYRGEVWTEQQIQDAADRHYAQIMGGVQDGDEPAAQPDGDR